MNKREILKRIIENWFVEKTSIRPTKDGLNSLVDRIHYKKQLNLTDVSQHRELLVAWEKRRYSLEEWKIVEEISIEFIDDWLSN